MRGSFIGIRAVRRQADGRRSFARRLSSAQARVGQPRLTRGRKGPFWKHPGPIPVCPALPGHARERARQSPRRGRQQGQGRLPGPRQARPDPLQQHRRRQRCGGRGGSRAGPRVGREWGGGRWIPRCWALPGPCPRNTIRNSMGLAAGSSPGWPARVGDAILGIDKSCGRTACCVLFLCDCPDLKWLQSSGQILTV